MSVKQRFKTTLYPWYCAVTGRGGDFLKFRRELHRRREKSERRVLEEATTDPSLFRENCCPACGCRTLPREEFHNPIGYNFAVCPHDGTVFMDPVPTNETLTRLYNDPAETFLWLRDDDDGEQDRNQVHPAGNQDFQSLCRLTALPPGSNMLEVGCANGAFLLTAKDYFTVSGCELNDATAEVARQLGFNVLTGGIESVPGEDRFDAVVMLQVIEHLPSPHESILHARRLLKPGGYLYFNTPSIDSASFKLLRERHIHVSSFGHVSLFNEKSIRLLAERTGFEVKAYEPCGPHDLELHDLLTLRLSPRNFRHRHAMYRPRVYFACQAIDQITFGLLAKLMRPAGNNSYHRSAWQLPLDA